jgi:hypothetical protein
VHAELPLLLEQRSLLENADPQCTEVLVAAEDDAPELPAQGHPFEFRSVRLDLLGADGR